MIASIDNVVYETLSVSPVPYIEINQPVEIDEGGTISITNSVLKAADNDSDESALQYTVTTDPVHGRLENSDSPGAAITTFTQGDIDSGKIRYVHNDSDTTSDSFVFKISDGVNELTNQTFNITVRPVYDDPIPPGASVATFDALSYTSGTNIPYSTPIEGFLFRTSGDLGMIYYSSGGQDHTPALAPATIGSNRVERLTIKRNDASKLDLISMFLYDSGTSGSSAYTFEGYLDGVKVYTKSNVNVKSPVTVTFDWDNIDEILVIATGADPDIFARFDNIVYVLVSASSAPYVEINQPVEIYEGDTVSITNSVLKAADNDSDESALLYTITTAPLHGQLENTDNAGVEISAFTQGDIDNGKICYVHDDSNTTSDSFVFKISDGVNELTNQTFNITVRPVYDDPIPPGASVATFDYLGGTYSDGEAISNIAPIEGFLFRTSDDFGMIYYGSGGQDNTPGLLPDAVSGGTVERLTIKRSNASSFKLISMFLYDSGTSGSNAYTFEGYLDGVKAYTKSNVNVKSPVTVTFDWDNVDEILVIATGANPDIFAYFDNIVYQDNNVAPTDITLSDATIAENAASGTAVGTFTTTDADVGDVFTYSLVSGIGDADNGSFTIAGDELRAATVFDYETKSSYNIRVKTTDAAGATYEKAFTVTVTDVYETLAVTANNLLSLLEDASSTTIGDGNLKTTVNAGLTATYTLTAAPGRGALKNNGVAITTNDSFAQADIDAGLITYTPDADENGADSFTFSVSDGTNAITGTFNITIEAVNDAPVITGTIAGQTVDDNATIQLFGGVTVSDPDSASVTVTVTLDTATKGAIGGGSRPYDSGAGTYTVAGSPAAVTTDIRALVFTPTQNRVAPGSTETTVFTIAVSDGSLTGTDSTTTVVSASVNDAPTDITLSPDSILAPDTGTDTVVGTLGNDDPDAGETYTYLLVLGTGDAHNTSFNISGASLRTNSLLTAGTYYIRVQVSDGSATHEKALTVTVANAPGKTLTADTTHNSVDNDVEIAFTADSAFESAVNGVRFNGTSLIAGTDFTVNSGKITLIPGGGNAALRIPATANVVVTATGYQDSTVSQTITAGAALSLVVTIQPAPGAETGDPFATQPVVTLKDQYDNTCADGPSATASVTASAVDGTGTWTVGGTVTKDAVNGVATFDGLTCTLQTTGTGSICFTSGLLTVHSAEFLIPERNSSISPASAQFDRYSSAAGYQDIAVTVTLNGNTLVSIKNGGYALAADSDYTISGDIYTIKKGYLSTLSIGSASLSFDFSLGADCALTVTVLDSTPSYSDDDEPSGPIPTYRAEVKAGDGGSTLPVTVDADAGIASIDAGFQSNLIPDGESVVITVPSIPNVKTYAVGIPVSELSTIDKQGSLTVDAGKVSVTVLPNMLTGVEGISGTKAQITIGEGDKTELPDEVKEAIGDRPLIQLTLSIDGKQVDWSNPNAPVTMSIPYVPTNEELKHPESIVVWYIDGSGNVVTIPNGYYDPVTGTVVVDITHFSEYAVAYNPVSFDDVVKDAWYAPAVSFIAAREITTGTGNGKFSPEAKLTRGEFIVLIMRAYGIGADDDLKDNFSDAGSTYYTGYLAAAKRMGISAGVGNNRYAPDKEITRQEIFTMLYNALKIVEQLPKGDSGMTLSDFSDSGQVDSWAKEAVTLLVKTGAVGGDAGKLTPAGMTTRAEMAQMLYNLLCK